MGGEAIPNPIPQPKLVVESEVPTIRPHTLHIDVTGSNSRLRSRNLRMQLEEFT